VEAQTVRVMENLRLILEGVGLDLSHVVQMRAYLTEFERDYAVFNDTYQRYFPEDRRPARTTVGVTALAVGALVEIDCIARRPEWGWLTMFQRSPLSLMGWLALLAALGSAGLAVVAFMLPSVEDAICPMDGSHTLPSGGRRSCATFSAETQPFHLGRRGWWCAWWCRSFRGRVWRAPIPIRTGSVEKSGFPQRRGWTGRPSASSCN
jgi:hypothetical protein